MKFAEYETLYDLIGRSIGKKNRNNRFRSVRDFHERYIKQYIKQKGKGDAVAISDRSRLETLWYEACRPYYKVWPAISPAIENVSLDFPGSNLRPIRDFPICVRTPSKSALVGIIEGSRARILLAFLDDPTDLPFVAVSLDDRIIGNELQNIRSEIFDLLRLAVGVHLLADNPDFIKPEVLNEDRAKFAETGDQKYIEKAKRRGKFGWNVGEHLESVPHLRRPHFGIRYGYWGGEEITPRLRPVKGAVVHRDKMRRIPTGYITPEGVEIEPA